MCDLARLLLRVERFGLYAPADVIQDAMAENEKKTGGEQGTGEAPESTSGGDQSSLADILSQQREQLEAKLGPDALLPDISKLPEANADSAPSDVEASAAAQESGQAPGEVDDVSADDRTAEATQSLAEVIEQQAAQLRARLGAESTVPDTGDIEADESPVAEDVPTETPAPDDDVDAGDGGVGETAEADQVDQAEDQAVAAASPPGEASEAEPAGEKKAESPAKEEEGPTPEVIEAQLTLAQIIAEQRAKLRAEAEGDADAKSGTEVKVVSAAAPTRPPERHEPKRHEPKEQQTAGGRIAKSEPPAVKDDVTAARPEPKPKAPKNATPAAPDANKKASRTSRRSAVKGNVPAAPVQGEAGTRGRRTFLIVLFLGMNTILIGVVAVAVLRFLPSATRTSATMRTKDAGGPSAPTRSQVRPMSPLPSMMGGEERKEAEIAFKFGKFRAVAGRYKQLMDRAALRPADALARDLFATRYARCLIELDQGKQARPVLRKASQSESPILQAYAHHMLAFLDFRDETYMSARRHGYAAIGALGAMREGHPLVDDCEYLIARAMSAKVLSLGSEKMDLDSGDLLCKDPMLGLSDVALYRLLGNGVETLAAAKLSPSVARRDPSADGRAWVARWAGPPLEQFLRQISASSGFDIRWGSGDASMRQRGVTVVFPEGVSEQRLAEVACGMTGLMARFTGSEIIVMNPRNAESTKIEKDILGREAVSMWRRFILQKSASGADGRRIAVGQYALARTYENMEAVADALREYRLTTRQHASSSVAPSALFRSGMLRLGLLDFDGAKGDMLEMLDRYPDSGLFGPAYLNLGIVIRKKAAHNKARRSILLADAMKVFRRLYHLNVSRDTRRDACLEMARCLNALGDHAKAAEWATKYLGHIDTADSVGMSEGYFMLARTSAAANNLNASAEAFYQVLGSNPSADMRVKALMQMIPVQIAKGGYVRAVAALNVLGREKLTTEQHVRYLVVLSESYRAMRLTEKVIGILQRQIAITPSRKARDTLSAELARCYIETGNYKDARELLSGLIRDIPLIQVELADVSLKLGETTAAIAAAKAIVDMSDCPEELRRRAGRILGQAYVRTGQYDLAASALMKVAVKGKGGKGDG